MDAAGNGDRVVLLTRSGGRNVVDHERAGVQEWIEELDAAQAPDEFGGSASDGLISRMIEVASVSVADDRVVLHHRHPIYRRAGTLVLHYGHGKTCRLELRLFWTRFSSDRTYHTVGVIKRAWPESSREGVASCSSCPESRPSLS